jgi:hypothetical protein
MSHLHLVTVISTAFFPQTPPMAVIATSDSEAEPNEPSHIPHKRTANNGTLSPGASSTASDSPTPTNSVKERKEAWSNVWQGLGIYYLTSIVALSTVD